MKISVIEGDLLDATEDYIVHQCNCVTSQSRHIAQQMFDKYPYSNTYKFRTSDKKTHNTPGTIDIKGNGNDQRYIINMYSQYYPSYAKYSNDSKKLREDWFKKCLQLIAEKLNFNDTNNTITLAMPYKIGCGSAGGDWDNYMNILTDFTNHHNINITLYKLDI